MTRHALIPAAFLLGATLGCIDTKPNPVHCWNADGDATCREQLGIGTWYCTTDAAPCGVAVEYGCVAERPTSDECYSRCGGGKSILEDDSCPVEIADGEDESGDGDGGPDDAGESGAGSCGDGVVDPGEECDDGNDVETDACTSACLVQLCGNGELDDGEACDGPDWCLTDCRLPGGMLAEVVTDLDKGVTAGREVLVREEGVYVLGQKQAELFELVKFDAGLGFEWSRESLNSEQPSLCRAEDVGVVVGGKDVGAARFIAFTGKVTHAWDHKPIEDSSSVHGVDSMPNLLVAAINSDGIPGRIARLDPSNGHLVGAPHSIDADPLGPIAVDPSGQVWAVSLGDVPKLHSLSSDDELGTAVELEPISYTEIHLDSVGNVYLLGHTVETATVFKYEPGADSASSLVTDGPAGAESFALISDAILIIAGEGADGNTGSLTWHDTTTGARLLDPVSRAPEGMGVGRFHDVAVAPSGEYAVAVGAAEVEGGTNLWVYKFEI